MPEISRKPWFALVTALLLLGAGGVQAQSYLDLESQVQEFTLDNGIRFLVLERHDVPVFSFRTYVNVGSANEVTGITGIAHILEHMAFKGTSEIGTKNIKKERQAMAAEDAAFEDLLAERRKGDLADPAKLAQLQEAFDAAKEAAKAWVVSNEFGQIIENNGGRGMNANTSCDATNYFYMFPSNRLELWAYLEGSRMADPVLREFYTEKDGPVTEERRMRTDNNPIGRLIEQFQNAAFIAHPYHHSTIGYMSDLQNISRSDCLEFYRRNYVGSNFTVAVVGDVKFEDVQKLARKYFRKVPDGHPFVPTTVEPAQICERRVTMQDPAQPFLFLGYHKGGINSPDDAVYDAIADILGQGRTSRLYKALVKEKKLAVHVGTFSGYPGQKYPNLMLFFAVPAKGVTAAECEEVILAEIDKLIDEGVTAQELAGVKQRTRADFIRSLEGNSGLARQLCFYQSLTGDWRNAFKQVEKIEAVTLEDIQRVAAEIFEASNRTVASIVTEES